MRVLVTGANGMLGIDLCALLEAEGHEVIRTDVGVRDGVIVKPWEALDITDTPAVSRCLLGHQPDAVVHGAAYTDVDGCEANRDLAFDVNSSGAANVARVAKRQGARLLFLSTDYVFDGTKMTPYTTDDARSPRSVYGQSKAEAEVQLGQILPECCTVRTSWLFGTDGKCFPDTILKLAASRPQLEVVGDQRGSPTYSVDLARALIQLCRQGASGVVHVTNRGECSWYEFAREIVAREGLNTVVHETTSDRFVRPAERPKYSVLSPESLQKRGIEMPEWRDALQQYLAERVSK